MRYVMVPVWYVRFDRLTEVVVDFQVVSNRGWHVQPHKDNPGVLDAASFASAESRNTKDQTSLPMEHIPAV